ITRAQDGTTALAFVTGDKVELRLVNAGLQDMQFGRLLNVQIFTTPGSATYTPTQGVVKCLVRGVAGGGAGQPATASGTTGQVGGGGGAGAYAEVLFTAAQIGASQSLVVGAGGVSGGTAASNSTFGTMITLPAGKLGSTQTAAGASGVGFGGAIDVSTSITTGTQITATAAAAGSAGFWTSATFGVSGAGASSPLGGGGGGRAAVSANGYQGFDGSGYGSGGGGGLALSVTGTNYGGNGGNGCWIIYEYA
ncbi:MAG TPA: hypothetical protein VFM18_21430, partial [Methanosarcina sp.]|nr:hypothetical protein [Methanosarcina sp.]